MAAQQSAGGRERAIAWGVLALWTGVVFGLSTDRFSADETSRIIGPILDFFFPGLSPEAHALVHALVRKAAHVLEYAVLGVLAWRAVYLEAPARVGRGVILALAFVVSVAALDEAGQATRASRTGSTRDVGIDAGGGAAGIGLALVWLARARRRTDLSLSDPQVP